MRITASVKEYKLIFRFPAGTSRGVLNEKRVFYLILERNGFKGIGECSTIPGLSIDDREDYSTRLNEICREINSGKDLHSLDLEHFPSIAFGVETALLDLHSSGSKILFPGLFTKGEQGITINGLVWMGDKEFMQKQIHQKIESGFRCIKLKIGAIDFQTELNILSDIRKSFSPDELEIRVDANGAFSPGEAPEKLKLLSQFTIHSIEQPVKAGQWDKMAELCSSSPIPIVLDEELIGICDEKKQKQLLSTIKPSYIILKPSLIGGLKKSEQWIRLAEENSINWWITSALESNIGLNVIAQWTSTLGNPLPQGLGTGQLYENNIRSPLKIRQDKLYYEPNSKWDLNQIIHV